MSTNGSKAPKDAMISLADEDAVKQVLVNSVLGLWDVVNNLTRLRPSTHERYRVTIFGSARVKAGTFRYEETKRVAAALAEMGCDIITGGGPGLMQAANEGAATAPERAQSVGIRVDLPFEQEVNAFVTEAFEHRTFFTRLHQFVLTSDAFIVAPGGVGTVLEMMMIWQLSHAWYDEIIRAKLVEALGSERAADLEGRVLHAGADLFLSKSEPTERLLKAIRALMNRVAASYR